MPVGELNALGWLSAVEWVTRSWMEVKVTVKDRSKDFPTVSIIKAE